MKNLAPIILILVAGALYFAYIDPMFTEDIAEKERVRDQYDTAIETTQRLAVVLGRHIDTYNSFSDDELDRLDRIVPEEIDPLRLIVDVDTVARALGVRVTQVDVQEVKEKTQDAVGANAAFAESEFQPVDFEEAILDPKVMVTSLNFEVTTTYEKFLSLLQNLEQSLRIMDIVSIEIAAPEGGETEERQISIDDLTYSVQLHTYSLGRK